mmetsp:Transcript_40593/g.92063  ORF Transcript_40593/g.92063 Transcript_40593/m.92063 type:complete len:240 (-) Transcript_40593:97-816(-)
MLKMCPGLAHGHAMAPWGILHILYLMAILYAVPCRHGLATRETLSRMHITCCAVLRTSTFPTLSCTGLPNLPCVLLDRRTHKHYPFIVLTAHPVTMLLRPFLASSLRPEGRRDVHGTCMLKQAQSSTPRELSSDQVRADVPEAAIGDGSPTHCTANQYRRTLRSFRYGGLRRWSHGTGRELSDNAGAQTPHGAAMRLTVSWSTLPSSLASTSSCSSSRSIISTTKSAKRSFPVEEVAVV